MILLLSIPPLREARASNVGDSLIVGIQSTKTDGVYPLNPVERDIVSIYHLVYESLVYIDDDYMPQPLLAESWTEDGEGKTWTFNLRRNVTFSDGTPMTARDVVATVNYILEMAKDEESPVKGYYSNLKYFIGRITAPNDYTVVIRAGSGRSYYGLLYAMTFPILSESDLRQENPMGTGPYIITRFRDGQNDTILLEANQNWWKNLPKVRSISFVCYSTQRDVIEAYEYGRVNTIFSRAIAASQYKSGTNSLSLDYRTNQLEVLMMYQDSGRLRSVNVRKAIRHAIDVDYIANHVYMGMVYRTDTPAIPGTWLYNDGVSAAFGHDVEKARRLLEEDGWADTNEDGVLDKVVDDQSIDLSVRLYVYEEPDNDVRFEAANIIKEQLAVIGIKVDIVTGTYQSVKEKLQAGSFAMALCSFAMDPVPDYGFLLMNGNTGNFGRYRSGDMLDLCNRLRTCYQPGEFRNTLWQIQELFAEDCPFLCLYYRGGTVLTRYMYTTVRDVRELELLRGIESFNP